MRCPGLVPGIDQLFFKCGPDLRKHLVAYLNIAEVRNILRVAADLGKHRLTCGCT